MNSKAVTICAKKMHPFAMLAIVCLAIISTGADGPRSTFEPETVPASKPLGSSGTQMITSYRLAGTAASEGQFAFESCTNVCAGSTLVSTDPLHVVAHPSSSTIFIIGAVSLCAFDGVSRVEMVAAVYHMVPSTSISRFAVSCVAAINPSLSIVRYDAAPVYYVSPIQSSCTLLILVGGTVVLPARAPEKTNTVSCSSNGGVSWHTPCASFPTALARATALQFGTELLVMGGQREDGSASIMRAVMNHSACRIEGWEVYAFASPMTDRYNVLAGVFNRSGQLSLVAGAGEISVGSGPLRAVNLWSSSEPSNRSSWSVMRALVPPNAPYELDYFDRHRLIADLRGADGRTWGLNRGPCEQVLGEDPKLCPEFTMLATGDSIYVQIAGVTDPTQWVKAGRFLTYYGELQPLLHDRPPSEEPPPLLRQQVLVFDMIHGGAPVMIGFEPKGTIWRTEFTPCWDSCPSGWWTQGCFYSPYDAVCRRCSECAAGTYQVAMCRSSATRSYLDTTCKSCTDCESMGMGMLSPCNGTHDAVCMLQEVRPAAEPIDLLRDSQELMALHVGMGACAGVAMIDAVLVVACVLQQQVAITTSSFPKLGGDD